jgi:hypothetical protein
MHVTKLDDYGLSKNIKRGGKKKSIANSKINDNLLIDVEDLTIATTKIGQRSKPQTLR